MRSTDAPTPTSRTSATSRLGSHQPPPLLVCSKVHDRHLSRQALVYVRQSTLQQVANNRESTDRQYALDQRAIQLGWAPQDVAIIDDDQGLSGQSADARTGFQSLLGQIAQNGVGIVLGLEMSRLARSNKDWHQLLELCALFDTLLADADGVYDPGDYNDRLLLGLKGTMSEAELHILRARMNQGLLNKARRAEVFNHPPIGYVRAAGGGGYALDPDEQVQSVVRLLFDQFVRQGSVCGLLRYLVAHQIKIPVRPHAGEQRDQLQWHVPNRVTLQSLLHHPIYAGMYRWGHRTIDKRKAVCGRPRSGRRQRPPAECLVLLADKCPAYITAEQFAANQKRLSDNRSRADSRGAVRHGPALLSGLVVCGRCGYRMVVNYHDRGQFLRYACNRAKVCYGTPVCQSLSGTRLDEFVAQQVLLALQPAALELHLACAADVEKQRTTLHRNWQQQLERARFESGRAARQYQQVEPENRLVARELERLWNEALREEQRLENEYRAFCATRPATLSANEREQIRQLASDVPQLWNAASTTAADRQRLVRLLIEQIRVTIPGNNEQVQLEITWSGGGISRHALRRGVQRYEQLADFQRLRERIEQLRGAGHSHEEVARRLNEEGFHPPRRVAKITGGMVSGLCRRAGSGTKTQTAGVTKLLHKGECLLARLARELSIPQVTLHRWRRVGWLRARKLPMPGGLWAVWAPKKEKKRLRALRQHQTTKFNQPIPQELTTPARSTRR
jgi:DNA invertase Pin-like site-specific DNA recombinase